MENKTVTESNEAPPHSLAMVLDAIKNGGIAYIATYYRVTVIDSKTVAKFEKAGQWLLREDGNGYRLRSGRGSVYLHTGQLKIKKAIAATEKKAA